MSLLEVKNLDVRFKHSQRMGFASREKIVLHNITFSLEEGEALGIIGESGSGKTTLARCIAGMLEPTSGTIEFEDINIHPETKNRNMLGSKIQLVFQAYSASLDPQITIERIILEGIQQGRNNNSVPSIGVTAKELCFLVGLPNEILKSYPFQLSGGQKQRVALARAISVQPRLLILDEPTSALDVLTQAHVLGLIKKIRFKYAPSLIFITHNIANSMLLCDRVAVLHQGSIVEIGDTKKIGEHPSHPYTKHLFYSSR